jgi:hypothetical protein
MSCRNSEVVSGISCSTDQFCSDKLLLFAEGRFVRVEDEDAHYCVLNSEELFKVLCTKK